jgi:NAD(P)-dependent dehydrogenase (short-subunit alcohol dehydrogenase family)
MEDYSMSNGRLANKVAIITGGGGGIGSAAGRIFAEQGAKVALLDYDAAVLDAAVKRIKEGNPTAEVIGIEADLGREETGKNAVDKVVSTFGGVDVLVNNVGIRRYESVADASWDTWDPVMRINLLSFVSMSRAALEPLRKSGRGSIINVSSTGAVFGRKGMVAYDAAKAAVLSFARTLACEEAPNGIRVNSICPGYTRTPFHDQRMGTERVDALIPPCFMQRWASPEELAYPMLWLASDEASYVTAATFMIDGGYPLEPASGSQLSDR